jgi:uncharacterized membrane protein YgdD (TMEM256/DUF423 family)
MRLWIIFAGIVGAILVGVGAYASHRGGGGEQARAWLQTGAQFGLLHCLALLGVAALAVRGSSSRWLTFSAIAFAAGIILFSGTLIARALIDIYWISKATPFGGLCFIAGWLLLAAHGVASYLGDETED